MPNRILSRSERQGNTPMRYCEEHAEIQAQKDARTEEERQARRKKVNAQARARREKERLQNSRPEHVVPNRNKRRNQKRQKRRAQSSTFDERAKLQQRVQRAQKPFDDAIAANFYRDKHPNSDHKFVQNQDQNCNLA